MGATTTWERWDSLLPDGEINPGGMTSFNHYALGSVAHWFYSGICGLEPQLPGWARFSVSPHWGGGLTHASTRHITPYGEIRVSWDINQEQGTARIHIHVPAGTVADVPMADRHLTSGDHDIDVPL